MIEFGVHSDLSAKVTHTFFEEIFCGRRARAGAEVSWHTRGHGQPPSPLSGALRRICGQCEGGGTYRAHVNVGGALHGDGARGGRGAREQQGRRAGGEREREREHRRCMCGGTREHKEDGRK